MWVFLSVLMLLMLVWVWVYPPGDRVIRSMSGLYPLMPAWS